MAINVSDNNPRVNYTATSGQTVFTVPFEFFASTDLTVYVGGSVLATSAYTVTGGSGSTGSITTDSGQTAGAEIAIVRDVPLERTTDLTSSYSASSLNDQLDRIVTQVADLDDRVSRSISLNDYEVGVSLDLPAKASRLGKTVQFNASSGALEVGPSGDELTSIASIASEITSLNGIKANITTVAGAISNVNSVGSNISSVTSVASSISNVNTVNTNIANVNSVAGSISDLNDVADSLDQVELVGGSISNVDVVGAAISNVNTVASGISNINIVAGISGNVATVAGITSAISTVNSNATNINTAATNIANVNVVANVITKVTTVSDNIANVNTVAPSVSYLSTVANNIANINTLAPISADITTVAGVASSVSGAAANAAAAEAAKVAAQAAQAAAELAADNFDDTYLGAKASDPTLDNDGDSLGNGDLYFNTTDGTLKVYNNSAWQAAALDASGFVDVTGDSMTGNLLFGDGNEARFGTHGDLTIEHDLNNSNIIAANNKPLNITANGGFNINSDNIYFREHAASNTYMEMRDGGGYDHAVRIFHSGTDVRLETTSTGIDVTGTVTMDGGSTSADFTFGDNDKAIFGAGSDLQIYHDGINSYIDEQGTGSLNIRSSATLRLQNAAGTNFLYGTVGGEVVLYYDGNAKLSTTSTGVDITGVLSSDGLTVDGTSQFNTGAAGIAEFFHSSGYGGIKATGSATGSGATVYLSNDKSGTPFDIYTIFADGSDDSLQFWSGGNPSSGTKRFNAASNGDISFYDSQGSSQSFFWDASAESLGIGTSLPQGVLDLGTASTGRALTFAKYNNIFGSYSEGSLNLTSNYYGDTTANAYKTSTTATFGAAGIEISGTGGTSTSGLIQFFVDAAASKTADAAFVPSERMRITSAGNVGIGCSPDNKVNIQESSLAGRGASNGNTSMTIEHATDTGIQFFSATQTQLRFGDAASTGAGSIIYTHADDALKLSTSGSEAMHIDGSGHVGIGVTPEAWGTAFPSVLQIGAAASLTTSGGDNARLFGNVWYDGTNYKRITSGFAHQYEQTGGTHRWSYAATGAADSTISFSEAMRIDSSGHVGIGESDPDNKLQISDSTVGTDSTADDSNFIKLTNKDVGEVNEVWGLGFSSESGGTDYLGGFVQALGNYTSNFNTSLIFGTRGTSGNATERMRIDSSGHVGIGQSNPLHPLHIGDTSGSTVLELQRTNTNTTGSVGAISFTASDDHSVAAIHASGDGDNEGAHLIFRTTSAASENSCFNSTSERMRIDSSGNVIFGGSAAVPSSSAGGAAFDPNTNGRAVLKLGTTSTGNQGLAEFFNPNGKIGDIVVNGSATAYNTSSDYRLKTDAQSMTGATDRLKQLNPVNFEWIADGTRVDGFLAHEAQAVVPEAVTGTKDAMRDEEYEVTPAVTDDDGNVTTEAVMDTRSVPVYQGIDQSKLVPLLVATIKELEARITALENA